jgi:hypothetical protein
MLRRLAEEKATTKDDIIYRALGTYFVLNEVMKDDDKTILVHSASDNTAAPVALA